MRLKRPSSRLRSLATRDVYFPFDRASHRPSFKQDWRFYRLLGIYVNSFLCASQDKPVIGVLVPSLRNFSTSELSARSSAATAVNSTLSHWPLDCTCIGWASSGSGSPQRPKTGGTKSWTNLLPRHLADSK